MRYSVELRQHTEDGDYTEDHYEFETERQAISFARTNMRDLHSILDYGVEDKDYDPKDITRKA